MSDSKEMEIFEPPEGRKYWVVKADAGKFYNMFIDHSLIAIGHLNSFVGESSFAEPFRASSEEIKRKMTSFRGDKPYCNPNNYGQVNSFVNEMNVGDWVLTKGQDRVRIGRIETEPRLDNIIEKLVVIKNPSHEKIIEMDFMLKRTVTWGPEIILQHLPIDVFLSLKTPMTLYNIDRYMESICYTLYPFFKIGNYLHFTIRINRQKGISNFHVTKIFDYLNELEFLSKTELNLVDNIELENLYREFALGGGFNLSTQASFHSPGDIWAKLGFEKKQVTSQMIKAIVIYAMLFGNSHLGMDGILDVKSRQLIWESIVKRIDMSVTEEASKKLELSMPNYKTEKIEGPMVWET